MDLIPTSQGGLYALLAPRDVGIRFLAHLTAQLALEGPVRVLDGGNCFQERTLQRKLRRHGRDVYQAVERIQVARAFTCLQMVALLSEQETVPVPTLVLDLLAAFGDESVSERQRRQLLNQALSQLQRLSRPALGIHPDDGVVIWLLGDDGDRHRLHQPFPISFYAVGENQELRSLWRFLDERFPAVVLDRQEQRDLFEEDPVTVLAAQVENPTLLGRVFYATQRRFPTLTYYNADVALPLRYAAATGVFPLARCRVSADDDDLIDSIEALDSPWDLNPEPPPLRTLMLRPHCDPAHQEPSYLLAHFDDRVTRYPLEDTRRLLVGLGALLRRRDPDLLLTAWGDSWLLPHLLKRIEAGGIDLPLNREDGFDVQRRPERTYHSYGQVIYRGPKLTLFGRWHSSRAQGRKSRWAALCPFSPHHRRAGRPRLGPVSAF